MSFDSIERSNHDSTEVLFLRFTRGTVEYYYTNADQDVTMNGVNWSAAPFTVDEIQRSGDQTTDQLNITVPVSLEAVQMFRGQFPSGSVWLRIYSGHATSLYPTVTMDANFSTRWLGTVSDVQQSNGANQLKIVGAAMTTAYEREGTRLGWGRNCVYAVYDPDTCKVDKNAFKLSTNVTALTGNSITSVAIATKPDGYYDQGFLEYLVAGNVYQQLAIEKHTGNTVTLLGVTENIVLGQAINLYPGCPQTDDVCANTFNNIPNYGGYSGMSGTDPFNGNPVF